MSKQEKLLNVFPEEIFFKDVTEGRVYTENIKIFNYSNKPLSIVSFDLLLIVHLGCVFFQSKSY